MNHFKIDSYHFNSLPALYSDFLADLTKEKVSKPLIIFLEEWDDNVVKEIDQRV
jgi:hypothetical protein